MHGSYERIEAGFAENVLRDLTGAATEVYNHDDEDLFEKIIDADKKGYMLAASAGNTDASKSLLEEVGLIGGHSYTLMEAAKVKTDNGTESLIKLRNPWG